MPRPQEGNPAWKASRALSAFKPGMTNRRQCSVIRKRDGSRCKGIAVNGFGRCYQHGGSMIVLRRKRKEGKLKHAAWTAKRSEQKRHADERAKRIADEWSVPTGGD